jgi:DNA-binding MarR family transcriptional regulator
MPSWGVPISQAPLPAVAELSADEELLWRSLGRIVQLLPRQLEHDMVHAVQMTMAEFSVLQILADSNGRSRMSDLARLAGLSPSRMTRLVDDLVSRRWVEKHRDDVDTRGTIAVLTDEGENRRRAARPQQVMSARRRVLDQIPSESVAEVGKVLKAIVDGAVDFTADLS